MDESYFYLTSILIIGFLIGILLLVFSTTKVHIDQESVMEEERLKYQIRRKKAARKAALEYLTIQQENPTRKISNIENKIVDVEHDEKVVDLRERLYNRRQRRKVTASQ